MGVFLSFLLTLHKRVLIAKKPEKELYLLSYRPGGIYVAMRLLIIFDV